LPQNLIILRPSFQNDTKINARILETSFEEKTCMHLHVGGHSPNKVKQYRDGLT
jgi:hypothetical protein